LKSFPVALFYPPKSVLSTVRDQTPPFFNKPFFDV
jgi:hypothetical protein